MIKPLRQDAAFLADVDRARAAVHALHVWWLGQSGFLVQCQGEHLLLDPYLSDSLTHKYANTDKPHVRMTERVVAPEALGFVQGVTASHAHTDHLDADTLRPLLRANPQLQVVAPEAIRSVVAERMGVAVGRPIGLDAGQSVCLGPFTIHAVPAAHETVERDAAGHCLFLGYIVRVGAWTIYHSGDTVVYPDMAALLRPWSIDVALLPINGRSAERRVAGNLWGREAVALAQEVGARLVIPCHYEMFTFNTATTEEFLATARASGQPCHVLRAGERWSSA